MSSEPVRVGVIVGSVRAGRFGLVVADWFVRRAALRSDIVVDEIDLMELPLHSSFEPSSALDTLAARVGASEAIVVVTPEYNHSYPGPLKTAIDSLGDEWHAKPVGFVSYGGISGGLRAVEPLRGVFAESHAITIRETVSFHGARGQFDEMGAPLHPEQVNPAADKLLNQLVWWALAVREAKRVRVYPV